MKRFLKYIVGITCAVIVASACNPLDIDTPRKVTIITPPPDLRPARTLSLVFIIDGSLSMLSDGDRDITVSAAKEALELLIPEYDLAGVVWFNTEIVVQQHMTNNKYDVQTALDQIPATNENRIWDGAYEGVRELIRGEDRDVRAAILVTDGEDNSNSTHSILDVINLADSNDVYVYTVGLKDARHDSLQVLSEGTGAIHSAYYDGDDLDAIFRGLIIDYMRLTK